MKSIERKEESIELGAKSIEYEEKTIEQGVKSIECKGISIDRGLKSIEQGAKSIECDKNREMTAPFQRNIRVPGKNLILIIRSVYL